MTACENPRCGREVPQSKNKIPRRFCNNKCSYSAWRLANMETRRQQAREWERRHAKPPVVVHVEPPSWPERRAAIVAKLGVPGMGIAPNTSARVRKGKRF